ncbi:choice-of-anchor tandem repeat GloVer-containing protein [Horticoccus sp. 23ND18S-11]|uniref:choice-of-anchor tandem repeat GloVer-containing protein n=1 Tax=Horticoccus sp. 23ND18S-11 TaxID=3391832 RepID=UPI0039C9CE7F
MKTNFTRRFCVWVAAALVTVASALAQTTRIYTFATSGDTILANFVQAPDGTLYGVTRQGGSTSNGYLFRLRPDGSDYQVVHGFTAAELGAGRPENALVLGADGALYGTTETGGSAGFGTVYTINTDGSGFRVLHSFTTGTTTATLTADGGAPRGGLVFAADGNLYGLTSRGTATAGATLNDSNGVIYRVAPDGSDYRVLYSFDQKLAAIGGILPMALIQGRDGLLYGTLQAVGVTAVGGIFSIRTDGTGFTLLTGFSRAVPANGFGPRTPVVHAVDGFIYGTTVGGGSRNVGTVFRMRTDGTGYQVIYSFVSANQSNGYNPAGAFFQGRDGSLYGRTIEGGAFVNGEGDIYKILTNGTGLRRLHSFDLGETTPVVFQGLDGAINTIGRVETGRTTVGNTTRITTADTIYRIVEVPGLTITLQPESQTIAPGGIANFRVIAPGATTYQWQRDGTNIAGATADRYAIVNLTPAANGTYTVVVGNGNPADSTTSAGAVLRVGIPNPGRLINLSILTSIPAAGDSFTLGYVVGGSGTSGAKPLVIRAAGPSLSALGVTGTLNDPKIELFAGPVKTNENDNWGGAPAIATAMANVGAFPYSGLQSLDSAVVANLPSGDNSVRVSAAGSGTGTVIAEIYDASPAGTFVAATPRLVNVSVLKHLGTGLTAGFVIAGQDARTVLIRAVGPTLGAAPFNVPGVVADPQLTLFSGQTRIGSNDNWGGTATLSAAFAQVGAFTLPPTSTDAALLISLAPGSYTAQVNGANNTTGIALVEVYEVP